MSAESGYKDPFGGRTSYTFQSGGGRPAGTLTGASVGGRANTSRNTFEEYTSLTDFDRQIDVLRTRRNSTGRAYQGQIDQQIAELEIGKRYFEQSSRNQINSNNTGGTNNTGGIGESNGNEFSYTDLLTQQQGNQRELMGLANQYRLGEINANTESQSRLAREEGERTNYRFDRQLNEQGRQFDGRLNLDRYQFDARLGEDVRQFDKNDLFRRDQLEFQSRFQREGYEQDLGRIDKQGEWQSRLGRESHGYRLGEISAQGDQNVRLENQTFENRRVLQSDAANQTKDIENNRITQQIRLDNTNRDASMRLWKGV